MLLTCKGENDLYGGQTEISTYAIPGQDDAAGTAGVVKSRCGRDRV